ncbi:MAG TPA: hypothetical protein VIK47_05605, partial [Kiloniellales bacterium]
EYPDLGLNDDGSAKVSFTAYLKPKAEADYNAWAEKAKTAGIDEAHKFMAATLKARGLVAQN